MVGWGGYRSDRKSCGVCGGAPGDEKDASTLPYAWSQGFKDNV